MSLFDAIQSASGMGPTSTASLEQTGVDTWTVTVPDMGSGLLTVANPGEARAAADEWFLTQSWKRLTRWDPDTGASGSCYILM